MLRFANPSNFLRLAAVLVPAGAVLSALTLTLGLYLAFFVAPADYQQGQTVRIMYVHVPSAWLGLFAYTVVAVASASMPSVSTSESTIEIAGFKGSPLTRISPTCAAQSRILLLTICTSRPAI